MTSKQTLCHFNAKSIYLLSIVSVPDQSIPIDLENSLIVSTGRPILYETTHEFLDYFGLASIEELPNIDDIMNSVNEEVDENKDLYTSKYIEKEDKFYQVIGTPAPTVITVKCELNQTIEDVSWS